MKRIFTTLLAVTMLCTSVFAFTDVATTSAYYDTIYAAVELGLFNGTSDTTFNPSGTMTRKQFLVVTTRALGLTDSSEYDADDSISKLKTAGILTGEESFIDASIYGQAMTREEMAYVMSNVLVYTGEELNDNISSSRIPDYSDINTDYCDQVLTVYSNGILMGTDDAGTFNPQGTLTRGAAATVLMRLMDSSYRSEVLSDSEYAAEKAEEITVTGTSIIIYEGETRTGRNAKAGDTYVKADGTTIILEIDPVTGILAYHQGGIAADLGLISDRTGVTVADDVTFNDANGYTDSFGKYISNVKYCVNPITGTGAWASEWNVYNQSNYPTGSGSFMFELSDCQNYYWNSTINMWISLCTGGLTDSGISAVKAANGL